MVGFNTSDFKAKFDSYGGAALSNIFTVSLISKNDFTLDIERDFVFFCHTVSIPGINIVTQPYRPDNLGFSQSMPIGIEPERLDCLIMIDDQREIVRFFHDWLQRIYNYSDSDGKATPRFGTNDHLPYEINYKSEYSCRMVIHQYSRDGSTFEYIFDGVYPVDLGSTRMSWSDQAGIMELPVHFSYSSMKTSGTRIGNPGDVPFVQLDLSSQSGIQQLSLPVTIRDIRTKINNFRYSVGRLKQLVPDLF